MPWGSMSFVSVRDLDKHFPMRSVSWLHRRRGPAPVVRAVDGISFDIDQGRTLGLVGESGCGKSTVARCITRLLAPTAGTVRVGDKQLDRLEGEPLREARRDVQMVFQDPLAALNPRMSVERAVSEPLRLHTDLSPAGRRERVREILAEVGLRADVMGRYPHELSGGQRQRVNIARALACSPRFVVLDEPTSALDVSLRARVILMLEELRDRFGLTYLFISHDLATVKYLAQRVVVMYLGAVVEEADTNELFAHPLHPYTRALLAAVPVPDPKVRTEPFVLSGEIPSPVERHEGCRLRSRCPMASPVCAQPVVPREVSPGHIVACHFA
jgi:oligopeptide/dipeptide ABC transporter ATP-binding protein